MQCKPFPVVSACNYIDAMQLFSQFHGLSLQGSEQTTLSCLLATFNIQIQDSSIVNPVLLERPLQFQIAMEGCRYIGSRCGQKWLQR